MPASADRAQKVVPAQVGFFAIYNPSLGPTDETLDDQIVYYSSPDTRAKRRRRRRTSEDSPPKSSQEERNERLRKIGLAQGMVEFGRDFSDGKAIDTIETEKSRVVLHELESGWWLLAVSIL
jgi:First Longin domain of INTU, CCZ1 and HPS4